MRCVRYVCGCLSAGLVLLAQGETVSAIRFANNDRLTGSLDSLNTEELVWNSPVLDQPTPFFLKNILDVTLIAKTPEIQAKHEATITLTNGDLVRGQLASVTDEFVELDTWFAERMKFNRLMISEILISERPDFIFTGPAGIEGWTHSGEKPAWVFQGSSFRSERAGSIARNVDLPEICSVAFDAEWREKFSLKLVLFSNDLTSDHPASGYEIAFQQRTVYLRKKQSLVGHSSNAFALQENEKARIEVRVSLKSGVVVLLVDGSVVDVWSDPDVAKTDLGKGIHFVALPNSLPVKISRIEVGGWDGEVDQASEARVAGEFFGEHMNGEMPPAEKAKPAPGRMELRNGDTIEGEVLAIEDGVIRVKTPFREVRLPVEVLRSVALKPVSLERTIRKNGDVRAWFADGSSLVFRLDEAVNGSVVGFSQNFGTARFKLDAFNRIEFNIYSPEFEEIRMADGW